MNERQPTLETAKERIPIALVAVVWLPFACGYFLSYLYRTINAMVSPDLVRDIGMNPGELGLLTGAYFLGFALFQLPLGVLLDRFGPRRVNAALLVFAAAGSALFSLAQTVPGLALARALIGLGVSACLMAAIKACVQWFPMSRLATLNGWMLAMGGVGAIAATAPVEAALRLTDWRSVFMVIAVVTLAVALLIAVVVPDRKDAASTESAAQLLAGMKTIFANAFFWRISLSTAFMTGSFMSIQGLWSAPWLRDIAGLERPQVAQVLLWLAVASTLGFALQGMIGDRLARLGFEPLSIFKWMIALSILVFALIALGANSPWVMVAYNLIGSGAMLAYSILSAHFPGHLAGRANTAVNLLVFIGAFATQWAFGALINLWPVSQAGYASGGYYAAFGVMLAVQLGSFAPLMFLRPVGRAPVTAD